MSNISSVLFRQHVNIFYFPDPQSSKRLSIILNPLIPRFCSLLTMEWFRNYFRTLLQRRCMLAGKPAATDAKMDLELLEANQEINDVTLQYKNVNISKTTATLDVFRRCWLWCFLLQSMLCDIGYHVVHGLRSCLLTMISNTDMPKPFSMISI